LLVKIKVKLPLINYPLSIIILLAVRIKALASKIKTTLPSSYNKYINDMIENTIKPNYIFKIDEFVKNSLISL